MTPSGIELATFHSQNM